MQPQVVETWNHIQPTYIVPLIDYAITTGSDRRVDFFSARQFVELYGRIYTTYCSVGEGADDQLRTLFLAAIGDLTSRLAASNVDQRRYLEIYEYVVRHLVKALAYIDRRRTGPSLQQIATEQFKRCMTNRAATP